MRVTHMLFDIKTKTAALVLASAVLTACGGSGSSSGSSVPTKQSKDKPSKQEPTKQNSKVNTNNKYLLFSQKNSNQLMAYNTPEGDSKENPFIMLNIFTKANAAELLDLTTNVTAVLSDGELSFVGFGKENKPVLLSKNVQNVTAIQKNTIAGYHFISVLNNGETKLYRPDVDKTTKQQVMVDTPYTLTQPKNQVLPAALLEIADEKASLTAYFLDKEINIYKNNKLAKTFSCNKPSDVVVANQQFAVKCDGVLNAYVFMPNEKEGDHKFAPVSIKNVSVQKLVNDGYGSLMAIGKKNVYNYTVNYENDTGYASQKISVENVGNATLCDIAIGKGKSLDHRMAFDNSVHAYPIEAYAEKTAGRFKLPKVANCDAMQTTGAEHAFYAVDNASRNLYHIDTHVGISYHVHNYMAYSNDIESIHDIAYVSFTKEQKDGE